MKYIRDLPSKEGGYGRTGSRTPMQWDDTKNAGFSTAYPDELYLPIDPDENRPTVKAQESTPDSLLNHVQQLIELRKNNAALQSGGKLRILYAEPYQYPFVYLREKDSEKFLIAVNPTGREVTASFELEGWRKGQKIFGDDVQISKQDDKVALRMEGITSVVINLK